MQVKPTEWEDISALLEQGLRDGDDQMIEALKNCPPDVRELWSAGVAEASFILDNN